MLKNHIRRCILGGILGLLAFGLYALLAPKQYEGRAEILVGASLMDKFQARPTMVPDDVLTILERGQPQSYETEIEILRSQGIFSTALQTVSQKDSMPSLMLPENVKKLYLLYDVENQPNSTEVLIKAKGPTPAIAADIANAIVEQYSTQRQRRADDANKKADNYLDIKLKPALDKLQAAEAKLATFKHSAGYTDVQLQGSKLSNEAVQIQGQKMAVDSQFKGAEAEVTSLREQLKSTVPTVNGQENKTQNPEINRIVAALNDAIAKLAHDKADFTSGPMIDEDQSIVDSYRKSLNEARRESSQDIGSTKTPNPVFQALQEQLATAVSRRESLARQVQSVSNEYAKNIAESSTFPQAQKTIAELQRDVDLNDLTYRQLRTVADDIHTRSMVGEEAIEPLMAAIPDDEIAAPNLLKYCAFGLLGGLTLGLLYSFSVESLRLKVYSSSQVAELTGVPVVAALPIGRSGGAAALEAYARKSDLSASEALKYVAFTSLANGTSKYKSVMFTEGGNALGGMTSALQYAIVLSETGLKVALVDGDIRRRSLSKAFNCENASGVADLIEKSLLPGSEGSLLRETVHPNLLFLPAGAGAPSAITSATSAALEGFMQYLHQSAEVIVIAAPPCDQYADASRLASQVDQVYLVIAAQRTSLPAVPRAKELLTNAGAVDVKVILAGAEKGDEGLTVQPRHAPAA